MLPVALPALSWITVPLREFAQRFQDPLLRAALPEFFQLTPPDFPAMFALATLAEMNDHESGYPIGGSLPLAQALAERYEAAGGTIHYKARVRRILVEDTPDDRQPGRAIGVELTDGSKHYADIVISACDGHSTIFDLLDARYTDETIRSRYQDMKPAKSIAPGGAGRRARLHGRAADAQFSLAPPTQPGRHPA